MIKEKYCVDLLYENWKYGSKFYGNFYIFCPGCRAQAYGHEAYSEFTIRCSRKSCDWEHSWSEGEMIGDRIELYTFQNECVDCGGIPLYNNNEDKFVCPFCP